MMKGVNKMKKHIELFNKFGRRFATVADCGKRNIEVDFYEISSGRYGMEISKVVVQYFADVDFVNILETTTIDVYELGDIFEVMPPISLSGKLGISKDLRDLYNYSSQVRSYVYGDIELSKSREIFLNAEIRKLFKKVSRFIHT